MAKRICRGNQFALLLIVCTLCAISAPAFGDGTDPDPVLPAMPFIFIENQGKYPEYVKYFTETADHVFLFSDDGTVIAGIMDEMKDGQFTFGAVNVVLKGKSADSKVTGIDKSEGVINYLLGNNPQSWNTDVPGFTKLLYSELYNGIDLSVSGKEGLIKREYVVDAYADPALIRMHYSGASDILLGSDGMLIVNTSFGQVYEQAPRSYQIEGGEVKEIDSAFSILDDETVGFTIGPYDETKELIIDPYIAYSSYLGGTYEDQGFGIAADNNGNAYICGYTASCNFPNTTPTGLTPAPGLYDGSYCHGSTDAFVSKIRYPSPGHTNATLEFSTYLGGAKGDFGRGIAVDQFGDMYVCGNTYSTDFPVLGPWARGGYLAGQDDAFVTKILSTGNSILYSSYIGGEASDTANAIAAHSDGSAYITGETTGNFQFKEVDSRYPVTAGAYQEIPNPDALMGDAFATKINPAGNMLTYSTYISGHSHEVGNGIAVDDFGFAYIVGSTTSSNLVPAGVPGKFKTIQGGGDAFIFKMDFDAGSPVKYASYLGGKSGWDYGTAVAVDAEGCAYVTGATASTDFPTEKPKQSEKGYAQDLFDKDAFVTKFASDGDSLEYSTYLGGSSEDYGLGIAVDDLDRPYVTGYTKSSGFPRDKSLKNTNNGNQDVFVTCYKPDMRYFEYSTTFGGYNDDVGAAIAVDSSYGAYVAGYTKSLSEWQCNPTTCPDTFPVYRWFNSTWYDANNLTGNYDAFITKLGHVSISPDFEADETTGTVIHDVEFTDLTPFNPNIYRTIWSFGDGNSTSCDTWPCNTDHSYYTPGLYDVMMRLMILGSDPVSVTKDDYIKVCGGVPVVNFTVQGFTQATEPVNVSLNTAKVFISNITSSAATSYQWNFGDGTGNATTANPTHSYTVPGAYNVALTVTDACGAGASTRRTANGGGYIHVYAPPKVALNATPPREICAGTPVSFQYDYSLSDYGQFDQPTAFLWNFGDGFTSTQRDPTYTSYNAAGNFTVSLTGTNPVGSATSTRQGYISVSNIETAVFTRSPNSGEAPLTVQFTDASTGNPHTWSWDFGDGSAPSTLKNPSHTYTTPGKYDVNLTVSGWCGSDHKEWIECVEVIGGFYPDFLLNATTNITPNNIPVNGTSTLSVNFRNNMTVEQGLVDTYWWDFNGDGTWDRTGTRGAHIDNDFINTTTPWPYTVLGNYTPVLRVANTTLGEKNTHPRFADYIGVYAPLIVNFTATPTTVVVGQTISFTDTSTGGPVAWAWQFGDGTANVTTQHPTHVYSNNGTYAVNFTITNAWGARNSTQSKPNITVFAANLTALIYVVNTTLPSNITVISGDKSWREVPVYLDQTDIGIDSYKSTTTLDRTTFAAFRNSAKRPSWIEADKFTWAASPALQPYNKIAISGFSVTGGLPPGSGPVPLGNVSISGLANGTTQFSFAMGASDTYCQKGINPLSLTSSPVNLTTYYLNPFTWYSNRPQDLNHDGFVDDFDGNDVANSQDVIVFFHALTAGECTTTPAPFDYDGNGVANLHDLIVFYTDYNARFPFS